MGTTLQNGVYLPNEGERNCYAGLKTNWEILDQKVADVTALQQAVAGALHREIVESLPTTDIDPNTIYMILSGTSATENVYNEFMYVNNAWELIGTSATDLTNYYTKAEVDGKLLLKANDSDVVHTSGNETIGGKKTFSDDLTIYNNDSSQNTKNLIISSSKIQVGDTSNSDSFGINFNAGLSYVASILASKDTSGTQNLRFFVRTKDNSNNFITSRVRLRLFANGNSFFDSDTDNTVSLGSSSYKFKDVQTYKVNGLEPSSLSLPSDRSARIDISSYFTNTGTGQSNNYTVPANGYINLTLSELTNVHCFSSASNSLVNYCQTFTKATNSAGVLYVLFPVRKNDVFIATWYTTTTVNVDGAYFIPCQGNV